MKKIADYIVDKRKLIMILYGVILLISVVGMLNVNVNYDMSKYLPKKSSTKLGMEKMSNEYGDLASITVMFHGLDASEQLNIKEEMASIPNVKSVVYLQDDETYQKDGYSKYMVAVSAGTYSKEAGEVLKEIRDRYQDYDIAVSGAVVDNELLVSTLANEIPVIAMVAVGIIFFILFLLCDSWIEPFLYMTCIGIAILINMGTNAFLPSVSFMTFAVCALLQLGLSMDYSIMLMNRYNQEKLDDPTPVTAMKKALSNAFGAITSSSVTTIVGLLVLVFMSFKIGQDMGIVLAKGVFISLLCIFTILPGLVVMFDRMIIRTHKKSLNIKMTPLMKMVVKARYVLIPIVVAGVVFMFIQKDGLGIGYVKTFDNEDQKKIEDIFGVDNQVVLLYENTEEEGKIAKYIAWLESQKEVNSVQDYTNTIGKDYTYRELADDMDITRDQAKMLYQMYVDNQDTSDYEKITMYDLICYLDENVAKNPAYSEFMKDDEISQIIDARKELEDGKKELVDARKDIIDGEKELEDGERELIKGEIETIVGERLLDLSKEQLEDGEKELADSEKQMTDGEIKISEAETEIEKNEQKITDGESELADAEKVIKDSAKQLEKGEAELDKGQAEIEENEKKLDQGEAQIAAAKEELAANEKQISEGEAQIAAAKEELAANEAQLSAGEKQLAEGKKQIEQAIRQQMTAEGRSEEEIAAAAASAIEEQLGEKEAELKTAREQLEAGKAELEAQEAGLKVGREQLEAGKSELAAKEAELQSGRKQLEAGKKELIAGKAELREGKNQLEEGKEEFQDGKAELKEGRTKLEAGKEEIKTRKQELADGRTKLENGKQELSDGRVQMENSYQDIADAKIDLKQGWIDLSDGKRELEDGKIEYTDGKEIYEKKMNAWELSDAMDESISDVENMLKIRRMSMRDVESINMTLEGFVDFVSNEVLPNKTYADAITDDMKKDLEDGQQEIVDSKGLMLGDGYNRMMISLAVPLEGEDTFSFIGKMKKQSEGLFDREVFLVGDSTMGYEMDLGFSDELNFVSLLTIVAILIVVLITFRSIISSVTLVAVIQSAVYIITAIVAMMGISVNYIALILVQCILMGSTIDYGILFMSNYIETRKAKGKSESVGIAMDNSIKTIMTSSLILISCCLTVGIIMTQEIIAQTCSVIAYGALFAVILVIFALPALTYMLDRFIIKNEKKEEQ